MNMDENSEFISRVFHRYNGIINVFNPAILQINNCGSHSQIGGKCSQPNIVSIYPGVIWTIAQNFDEFKYISLVTLIHELFHCDQIIDYPKMRSDVDYKNAIEAVTEMETYLYVANHAHEIANEFGITCMTPYNRYYDVACMMGYETGECYRRRDYVTHLICLITDMLAGREDIISALNERVLYDIESNLIVTIDNTEFYVKRGPLCMPLGQLNGLFYEAFFKYDLRGAIGQLKSNDGITWTLKIVTNCDKLLYKLVS